MTAERHVSMDAVRGFAVLGILLMNIVSMGMPGFAYVDPTYYGGAKGANLWVWAVNFVIADGKMRALFTMLFGASLLLIAERAGREAALIHYRRAFWLLVIGLLHGVLLWYGDILVFYAVAGALAFPFRRLGGRVLVAIGAAIFFGLAAFEIFEAMHASGPQGPPDFVLQADLDAYNGGFLAATEARIGMTVLRHTMIARLEYVEAFGLILMGVGLYRLGFFTLRWPTRAYGAIIAVGYLVAVPITAALAWRVAASGFDRLVLFEMLGWSALPRLFIALAHASVVMLLIRAGALGWLTDRLAAAGRMALTNYLATSLIASLVFNGYGLGLYGDLQRWQLYFVVAAIWAGMLAWSGPWLARFHYGPAEWAWRSLVRWRPQPFARGGRTATAAA